MNKEEQAHDESSLAQQALTVSLAHELAIENERLSNENRLLKPTLDLIRTVKLFVDDDDDSVLVLDLEEAGLIQSGEEEHNKNEKTDDDNGDEETDDDMNDNSDGTWSINLKNHNPPPIPFNDIHKLRVSLCGFGIMGSLMFRLRSLFRSHTPPPRNDGEPETVVFLRIQLSSYVAIVGQLTNIQGKSVPEMENYFRMSLSHQGTRFVTPSGAPAPSLHSKLGYDPFEGATFEMTALVFGQNALEPAVCAVTENYPLTPHHQDLISLKSSFKLIHEETSSAWERYKSLKHENHAAKTARKLFDTYSLSYSDANGDPCTTEFYLTNGRRHSQGGKDPVCIITASSSSPVKIPLCSLQQIRVLTAGNLVCNDISPLQHPQFGPCGMLHVRYAPHIEVVFQLDADMLLSIPEEEQHTVVPRILAALTSSNQGNGVTVTVGGFDADNHGFQDATVQVLAMIVKTRPVEHILELLGVEDEDEDSSCSDNEHNQDNTAEEEEEGDNE